MTHEPTYDELARVLGYYALGELRTARRTERGFVNDNWIVTTDRGRYFLKHRHPDLRQPDLIRAQHDLMRQLRQAGFPAPTIVATTRGETLLILEGEFYELQQYIEGEPYDHDRPKHLEQAAVTLGQYHTAVQAFAPQASFDLGELYSPLLLKTVLALLIEDWRLDHDPSLVRVFHRLQAHKTELADRFARHGTLPHLIIHGDYYAGNLLFDGDRVVGVVDYDKARWQPRVVELAEALIYFASTRPGQVKHLVYPGFLDRGLFAFFSHSYARAVSLERSEVRALPDYICCIWLQVSLTRLLKKGARPPEALEALREVLDLADWAHANAQPMREAVTLAPSCE